MKHLPCPPRSYNKTFTDEDIESLVSCAQQGDTASFEHLYRLLVDRVYRFAYARVGSKAIAQDIVSETWKKVWVYLPRYRRGSFTAFLFRIAYTQLVSVLRKQRPTESIDDHSYIAAAAIALDERVIKKETVAQLYRMLHLLPQTYATVITLRFIDGMSIKETATVMNMSAIRVRVTQFRALQKLRTLYQ